MKGFKRSALILSAVIFGLCAGCGPFTDKDGQMAEIVFGHIGQGIGKLAEVENSAQTMDTNKLPEGANMQNGLYFITCNYLEDMNGQGISFPDDYVGAKKRFKTMEKITFALHSILVKKENKIKFIAKDSNGDKIHLSEQSWKYLSDDPTSYEGKNCCCYLSFSTDKEGTVRGSWYLEDKFIGFSEVEVTK